MSKTVAGQTVTPNKNGKLVAKVRVGLVEVGDILKSCNVNIPDYRVTGLGQSWSEQVYIDEEDARSFGGSGNRAIHGQEQVQYAYVEAVR